MSLTCLHCKGAKAKTNMYCDDCFLKIGRAGGPQTTPEKKGAKFDSQKPPMTLLPYYSLVEAAKVFGFGAGKYGRFNWRQGIEITRLLDAVQRHVGAYYEGENKDPESGSSHLAHAVCGLLMALEMERSRPDMDDRFKS